MLGLLPFLCSPSLGLIHQHFGLVGIVTYVGVSAALITIVLRAASEGRFLSHVSERTALRCALLTVVLSAALFLLFYPVLNTNEPGKGSDRDDALNLAVGELLKGHYPYGRPDYLGNLPSPLPGALLLALPFVLFGNSALQNFFWLMAFFLGARAVLRNGKLALLSMWLILLGSPVVFHEIVTGGDLLANSLYLSVTVIIYENYFYKMNVSARLAFSVFSGCVLSSRPFALLVFPMIFRSVLQNVGFKTAIRYMGITLVSFLAVTLPFWFYSPVRFSPFGVYSEHLNSFGTSPWTRIAVLATVVMFACLVPFFQRVQMVLPSLPICMRQLFRRYAVVLYFPFGIAALMESIKHGNLVLGYLTYSLSAVFLATLSVWEIPERRNAPLVRRPRNS